MGRRSDAEGRTPGMNPFLNIMLISKSADDRARLNLTREEAITAYTRTSAYAEFEERRKPRWKRANSPTSPSFFRTFGTAPWRTCPKRNLF
jgi:hypothetical protein